MDRLLVTAVSRLECGAKVVLCIENRASKMSEILYITPADYWVKYLFGINCHARNSAMQMK